MFYDIFLQKPRIEGQRITYSWNKNPLLKGTSFWIEYPNTINLNSATYETLAPYLPVCLAFAAFGKVCIHLPLHLDDALLNQWLRFIKSMAQAVYKRKIAFELMNGFENAKLNSWEGKKTALLFGGGTESLLCLARLQKEKISPILVCFCGPNWEGSNEETNPHKFELQEKAAKDLGLTSLKIRTSFRDVFKSHDDFWKELLVDNTYNIITTALFPAFTFSFLFPVASQWQIDRLVAGNKKENDVGKFFYSFSSEATKMLQGIHPNFSYISYFNDVYKMTIAKELFLKYPQYLKYTYSCIPNKNERWCLRCPKCLRSYLYYKIYNIAPSVAGFDETLIAKNLPNLIWRCRWDFFSGDPGGQLEYNNLKKEAEESHNPEAITIIHKIYKYLWLAYFLNLFRRISIVQILKRPLKNIFYLLQGHSIKT